VTDDVSRETGTPSLPPTPSAARRVFPSDRLPLIEAYGRLLAADGVVRGLIGPREVPRLWERHLLNCAVLQEAVPSAASVCDVGSGAGLPGLVLAIARPDLDVTLVEPLLRRTTFLGEVVAELGLASVRVHRGRADSLHGTERFDVVTSRAVAPLDRLLEWSMPLVARTGALVAMKGSSARAEIAASASTLARMGAAEAEVLELGAGVLDESTVAVRVSWADPTQVGLAPASPGAPDALTPRRAAGGKRPRRTSRKGPQ
jgi:16S rRNA (guanine527-N7)-methyltransferase